MLHDPYTTEAVRWLLTHDGAKRTLDGLLEVKASIDQRINELQPLQKRIQDAVADIRTAVDDAQELAESKPTAQSIAEAVNMNAYIELQKLANAVIEEINALIVAHEKAWDQRFEAQQREFDLLIANAEAIARGRSPLPIAPRNATPLTRMLYRCGGSLKRFHEWCLYILPSLLITTALLAGFDLAVRAHLISR
ncbi:hypothetical protein SAMN05446935_8023 [Burkholderia sp. YR290]|nr:hypothetical protein SAMN05446935_8023 [Burkholderia sp. YR290]